MKPTTHLQAIKASLDRARILYGEIHRAQHWELIDLQGTLPYQINLFLCDYKNRDIVASERKQASQALKSAEGGTLGIQEVKQVVVNQVRFRQAFEKLPGVIETATTSKFQNGPELLWDHSFSESLGLAIKVNSLQQVKMKLDQLSIDTEVTQRGLEVTSKLFELKIVLIEN